MSFFSVNSFWEEVNLSSLNPFPHPILNTLDIHPVLYLQFVNGGWDAFLRLDGRVLIPNEQFFIHHKSTLFDIYHHDNSLLFHYISLKG